MVPNNEPKPLIASNLQQNFRKKLVDDSLMRWQKNFGSVEFIETLEALKSDAFDTIFTNYITVGHTRDFIQNFDWGNTKLIKITHDYDRRTWPHATHGFFRFKDQIGNFLLALN